MLLLSTHLLFLIFLVLFVAVTIIVVILNISIVSILHNSFYATAVESSASYLAVIMAILGNSSQSISLVKFSSQTGRARSNNPVKYNRS